MRKHANKTAKTHVEIIKVVECISFLSESASPQQKAEKIRTIFLLLDREMKQCYPYEALSMGFTTYVLLPGRIGEDNWLKIREAGFDCLYNERCFPYALILRPGDSFHPIITNICSNHNDFIYFIALFVKSEVSDAQLMAWVDIIMKGEDVSTMPPYALLTLESGCLLL